MKDAEELQKLVTAAENIADLLRDTLAGQRAAENTLRSGLMPLTDLADAGRYISDIYGRIIIPLTVWLEVIERLRKAEGEKQG